MPSTTLYEQALERLDLEMISLPSIHAYRSDDVRFWAVLKEITLVLARNFDRKENHTGIRVMSSLGAERAESCRGIVPRG